MDRFSTSARALAAFWGADPTPEQDKAEAAIEKIALAELVCRDMIRLALATFDHRVREVLAETDGDAPAFDLDGTADSICDAINDGIGPTLAALREEAA